MLLFVLPLALPAQGRRLSAPDSALVGRILRAEDARRPDDPALRRGLAHRDDRVRMVARRALWRIRDSQFVARDSLPPPAPAVSWPEPAWRPRYRALAARRYDCGVIAAALRDSAWPVRLRAATLAPVPCGARDAVVSELRRWVDELPRDVSRRPPGGVSWHPAAHGLVALARLSAYDARARLPRLAVYGEWHLRLYAARAAAALSDSATLRALASDQNDNVKEAAIEALSRLTGHADAAIYIAALESPGAQAVRAAALALKGSPHAGARAALDAAFERWARRDNESERDARVALLEAAGRPLSDDRSRAAAAPPPLPREAVALALGADIRLRVELSEESGGGSFTVRLRGDVAPIMAARVLELARRGYYDGGGWHRVEHDFVVQGGAPGHNEYVGYARYFRDELGRLAHPRGTVGMSTRGHDTGDAQWFINLRDNPRLVRDYTVFAEVVEGMDVVDGIMEGDTIRRVTIQAAPGPPAARSSTGRSSPAG